MKSKLTIKITPEARESLDRFNRSIASGAFARRIMKSAARKAIRAEPR